MDWSNPQTWMLFIWIGVFLISVIAETLTTEMVSIWFCLGSLFALILSLIPGVPYWADIIMFIVISAAALLLLRPFAKKLISKNSLRDSNIDEIIGKKGIVTKEISSLDYGLIKINDVVWTAKSNVEGEAIPTNVVVEVVAVNGNKLVVKKALIGAKEK